MQRWQGRVAVVTGASSGIGAAVCRDLVAHGLIAVGLARREDRLQALSEELKGSKGKFHYVKTDLTKEDEIVAAFDKIKKDVGGVDVLVNNAGIGIPTFVKDSEMAKWDTMFKVNVFAVGICIREALKSMKDRGIDDGHIINISSIAAHRVSPVMPAGVYCSTKAALRFLTEALRRELVTDKSKIKVTHLSPGLINTEFLEAGGWENTSYDQVAHIEPSEIAKAVHYVLDTPAGTQVNELTVRAVGEGV